MYGVTVPEVLKGVLSYTEGNTEVVLTAPLKGQRLKDFRSYKKKFDRACELYAPCNIKNRNRLRAMENIPWVPSLTPEVATSIFRRKSPFALKHTYRSNLMIPNDWWKIMRVLIKNSLLIQYRGSSTSDKLRSEYSAIKAMAMAQAEGILPMITFDLPFACANDDVCISIKGDYRYIGLSYADNLANINVDILTIDEMNKSEFFKGKYGELDRAKVKKVFGYRDDEFKAHFTRPRLCLDIFINDFGFTYDVITNSILYNFKNVDLMARTLGSTLNKTCIHCKNPNCIKYSILGSVFCENFIGNSDTICVECEDRTWSTAVEKKKVKNSEKEFIRLLNNVEDIMTVIFKSLDDNAYEAYKSKLTNSEHIELTEALYREPDVEMFDTDYRLIDYVKGNEVEFTYNGGPLFGDSLKLGNHISIFSWIDVLNLSVKAELSRLYKLSCFGGNFDLYHELETYMKKYEAPVINDKIIEEINKMGK